MSGGDLKERIAELDRQLAGLKSSRDRYRAKKLRRQKRTLETRLASTQERQPRTELPELRESAPTHQQASAPPAAPARPAARSPRRTPRKKLPVLFPAEVAAPARTVEPAAPAPPPAPVAPEPVEAPAAHEVQEALDDGGGEDPACGCDPGPERDDDAEAPLAAEDVKQPEWVQLYPRLVRRAGRRMVGAFLEDDPKRLLVDFVSPLAWQLFNLCNSEAHSLGLDVEEIEKAVIGDRPDSPKDYQFPYINKLRNMLRLREARFQCRLERVDGSARSVFSVRANMMRVFILAGIRERDITARVEDKWRGCGQNFNDFKARCLELARAHDVTDVTKGIFGPESFPGLLVELRNALYHESPKWLGNRTLSTDLFQRTCLSSLRPAMVEWLQAERALSRLAVGHFKDQCSRGWVLELDRPGRPPLCVRPDGELPDEGEQLVIDPVEGRVLFKFIDLKGASR